MAVYLGVSGGIQLLRAADSAFYSTLDPGDVDSGSKRFSFDFPHSTFVTGDRITIQRLKADGSASGDPLDFVAASGWDDGIQHSGGSWYVHVDPVGGIKLYATWAAALSGTDQNAITLLMPAASYRIEVKASNSTFRYLGQVTELALDIGRDVIDVDELGAAFATRVSGLIEGKGAIDCLWDWRQGDCGAMTNAEQAQYVHQLIIRQQLGSEFKARVYLKNSGVQPITNYLPKGIASARVFYDFTGLMTNVGMAFEPSEPVRSKIEFVTTGEVRLRTELHDGDRLLLEDGGWLDHLDAE